MAYVARIVIEADNYTFTFSGIKIIQGDLSTVPGADSERLETPGVNFQRHRERRRVFKDLVLRLTQDVASTSDMYSYESGYQKYELYPCKLEVWINNTLKRWQHTMIEKCIVSGRDGPLHGFGALSNSLHTLDTDWTLVRTQNADNGT